MKNNKRRIVLSITVISLVLLILVGLTYAYFLTNILGNTNNKSINVDTANLSLTYGDGNSSIITANKISPGTTIGNKTFTVTNTGNVDNDYLVILDNVSITYATTSGDQIQGESTTFESNDFVYTLTCSSSDSEACDQVTNETELPLVNNGMLIANSIAVGVTHTYTITVKYLETGIDQSDDMNKALSARVNIADISSINPYFNKKDTLAYHIINNSIHNANGTSFKMTPTTEVGTGTPKYEAMGRIYNYDFDHDITTNRWNWNLSSTLRYSDEIMYDESKSDYIVINYNEIDPNSVTLQELVNTVRGKYGSQITGGIEDFVGRLPILASDYNTTVVPKIGTTRFGGFNLIRGVDEYYNLDKELSKINDDLGTSYYYRGGVEDNFINFAGMCWRIVRIEGDGAIKLILDDKNSICNDMYNNDIDNDGIYYLNDRSIGEYTEVYSEQESLYKTFQTSELSSYLSKLKKGNWCYNGGISTPATLICSGTVLNKYSDNTTDMYVGALTANEMIFSGLKTENGPYNYLTIGIGVSNTLDPGIVNNYNHGVTYSYYNSSDPNRYHVVPAISLKPGTILSSGVGTQSNPYVIQ